MSGERQRERERERAGGRGRETERQTDRQRQGQRVQRDGWEAEVQRDNVTEHKEEKIRRERDRHEDRF